MFPAIIRDDGGVQEEAYFWEDADQWIEATRQEAQNVRLDRQDGQKKAPGDSLRSGWHGAADCPCSEPVWRTGLFVRRL